MKISSVVFIFLIKIIYQLFQVNDYRVFRQIMEPTTSTITSSVLQMNASEEEEAIVCGFTEECDFKRFFAITVLSCIACVGACCNFLLAWIFIRYRFNNLPPTLYPTFLAILDGLICCFYVLLFGVDAVHVYLRIEVG